MYNWMIEFTEFIGNMFGTNNIDQGYHVIGDKKKKYIAYDEIWAE